MTARTDRTDAAYRTYGLPTQTDTVGEWEGQEQLAAEQFDRLQIALIDAATAAGLDEYAIREILSTAWDVWGSEPGLLTITDEQIATYARHHVPSGE